MLTTASILAVDDTPCNLQLLAQVLGSSGYGVEMVEDGQTAIERAIARPPDLILLDIDMPGMSGFEVCAKLKQLERLQTIPVIFLSAHTEAQRKITAFAVGGVDYVTKPFDVNELLARVRTHLEVYRLQRELLRSNAKLAAANSRMSRDLHSAASIQRSYLPRCKSPAAGASFAWSCEPCDELGGDALNVLPLNADQVAFYVLDVSGHGVPAALLSVTISRFLAPPTDPSSILIRESDSDGAFELAPPSEVLSSLNRLFPFDADVGQFTTILYGVLTTSTGEFRYVSAGHPGPIHVGETEIAILPSRGFPIGVAHSEYEEHTLVLQKHDRLYLYSDGLFEVLNAGGEVFGLPRLQAAAARVRSQPLTESRDSILSEVSRWEGNAKPQDDRSLLAIELLSKP